jgi:hypothetical protein
MVLVRTQLLSRFLVVSLGYASVVACGDDEPGDPGSGGVGGAGQNSGGKAGAGNGGRAGGGSGGKAGASGASGRANVAGSAGTADAGAENAGGAGESGAGSGGESGEGGGAGEASAGEGGSGGSDEGGASGAGAGGESGGASGAGGTGGSGGIVDGPFTGCTPNVSAAVGTYVSSSKLAGWAARHLDDALVMHGCSGAASPEQCLSTYPRAFGVAAGAGWENVQGGVAGAQIRVLKSLAYSTNYRTRSSADGRFVAHGFTNTGNDDLNFLDLLAAEEIPATALYEPAFFPDQSGFLAQGSDTGICQQSVLNASPSSITFTETGCSSNAQVGLEASVAAGLSDGSYYLVSGVFGADDGGHNATLRDPIAQLGPSNTARFVRMINSASAFVPNAAVEEIALADRVDPTVSASGGLLAARVSRPTGSTFSTAGYALSSLSYETVDATHFNVTATEIARYCARGGTPTFSYDERWLTYHHYIDEDDAVELGFEGASDVNFAAYTSDGAANVYIIDLPTGARRRVTHMAAGQYALYPHFRSDGWLYFLVRDRNTGNEYLAASNAAILAAAE